MECLAVTFVILQYSKKLHRW